jgi:hypothetical protein
MPDLTSLYGNFRPWGTTIDDKGFIESLGKILFSQDFGWPKLSFSNLLRDRLQKTLHGVAYSGDILANPERLLEN